MTRSIRTAIYNMFRDTADSLYDAVTNDTYDRINLRAAIDSIVGDAHGDRFPETPWILARC